MVLENGSQELLDWNHPKLFCILTWEGSWFKLILRLLVDDQTRSTVSEPQWLHFALKGMKLRRKQPVWLPVI